MRNQRDHEETIREAFYDIEQGQEGQCSETCATEMESVTAVNSL